MDSAPVKSDRQPWHEGQHMHLRYFREPPHSIWAQRDALRSQYTYARNPSVAQCLCPETCCPEFRVMAYYSVKKPLHFLHYMAVAYEVDD